MAAIAENVHAAILKDTPVGNVVLVTEQGRVRQIKMNVADAETYQRAVAPEAALNGPDAAKAAEELQHYFARDAAEALPGWEFCEECVRTPFVRKVYDALRTVKAGETITYGELAQRAGHVGAARAVGTAMARNPVPLMVPCHRVIPANGCVGKFTGGPQLKKRLLELEGADLRDPFLVEK